MKGSLGNLTRRQIRMRAQKHIDSLSVAQNLGVAVTQNVDHGNNL